MSVDLHTLNREQYRSKHGLVFDADEVTLGSEYTNEFEAYRARREWFEILNRYFLLEKERDYDMSITVTESEGCVLNCTFVSACGRYAFWRLINHQAPEAEQKLSGKEVSRGSSTNVLANLLRNAPGSESDFETTILTGGSNRERRPTLIGGLLNQFRKLM